MRLNQSLNSAEQAPGIFSGICREPEIREMIFNLGEVRHDLYPTQQVDQYLAQFPVIPQQIWGQVIRQFKVEAQTFAFYS